MRNRPTGETSAGSLSSDLLEGRLMVESEPVIEAKRQLQEKYGFNQHEIEVVEQIDSQYYPHLARLLIYRSQKFPDETGEEERAQFLKLWQEALPQVWEEAEIDLQDLEVGEMGDLRLVQVFNAYQPRSSRKFGIDARGMLMDLEPEHISDPEARELVENTKVLVSFLSVAVEDSDKRRDLFRERLAQWKESGKTAAEFIRDFGKGHEEVPLSESGLISDVENPTVIEDVVASTYLPALAKAMLLQEKLGDKFGGPDTIALQKNTLDMLKNRFPELVDLMVEFHREKLIRIGTGAATHVLAPMFPAELKFQYEMALVSHRLTTGDVSQKAGERTVVPLHIPECATTPELWDTLAQIQEQYGVSYVTSVDSKHHLVQDSKASISKTHSFGGTGILAKNNDYSLALAFAPIDMGKMTLAEEQMAKYEVYALENLLRNAFDDASSTGRELLAGENPTVVNHTDFEQEGHHHRLSPAAAVSLELMFRKFGVKGVSMEELFEAEDPVEVELGVDIRESASWNGHGEESFRQWINPQTEWLWEEVQGMLSLTRGAVEKDVESVLGEGVSFDDIPSVIWDELKGLDYREINSMSAYDILKAAITRRASEQGTRVSESQVRALFARLSYYQDLLVSCPYWWSHQDLNEEKMKNYLEGTPTVVQVRQAATRLAEYSIRLVTEVGEFEKFTDYFFASRRLEVPMESEEGESGAVRLSAEMRDIAAERVRQHLTRQVEIAGEGAEKRKAQEQLGYWEQKMKGGREEE